jgi:acyl-coenzyme A thioesterase PaaI-like protein
MASKPFLLNDEERRGFEDYSISPRPVSSANDRELVWTATVTPQCCNRHDTLHGGVSTTWLTFLTLVHARRFAQIKRSSSSPPQDFETISYSTSLLKAVPRNSSCWIQTRIERLGKQITFTSARLFTNEGCTELAITAEHVLRKCAPTTSLVTHSAKL